MFAMSAKLLYSVLFLVITAAYFAVAASYGITFSQPPTESPRDRFSIQMLREKSHYVIIEEVDQNGRVALKKFDLPDYNDSEEQREDEERRREQRRELREASRFGNRDVYGCDGADQDEGERRKCLVKWKKRFRGSYRMWRDAMSEVMKDLEDKIKNLSPEMGQTDSGSGDLEFTSVSSPGDE